MSDPDIDPESEILRNEFALTNQERLHRAEANAVSARSILLQLYPRVGVGHGAYPMCRTYRVEKHSVLSAKLRNCKIVFSAGE